MKIGFAVGATLLLFSAQHADAHLRMSSHESRYGESEQKAGPCGRANGERTTDKVYIAKPGTQVTLTWDEHINHPSHFRIDFDLDGDDGFPSSHLACPAPKTDIDACFDKTNIGPYMVNNILDEDPALQSYDYTLPDVECDNCTLQIIQVMYDKAPYEEPGNDIYYLCMDIVLDNNGPDELTLMTGTPGTPDAGAVLPGDPDAGGGGGNGGGNGNGNGNGPVDGGCQTSGSSSGLLAMLLGLGLLWRRRRS